MGLYSLLWGYPAPILLALLLNELTSERYKRIVQSVSYLPYFISTVVIVGILKELMSSDGPVNNLIRSLGGETVLFFSRPQYFRSLFIGSSIWQGVGWGTIIYLAALSGIDPQLYEAAVIDGAKRWHKIIYITIPSIMPTAGVLFILNVGGILGSDFQKILLMYNEQIYETADIIGTYVYREGLLNARFSYTTAVGLMLSVISFALVFLANFVSRSLSETSLW